MADEKGQELLTPEESAKVAEVSGQVQELVSTARAYRVRSQAEAEAAAGLLTAIKAQLKGSDKARRFLVDPLNEHVRAINAQFKPNTEALEGAERHVKALVTAFRREQEELARAERARVEREQAEKRRQAEEAQRKAAAAAQAERERAAREAAAAQEAAERAERERADAIRRDNESRRARISRLSEESLTRLSAGSNGDAEMARAELDARRRAREAQEAAARAQEAETAAREAEAAARATPAADIVPVEVAAPARLAGVTERKRWVFEVTDPVALPEWAKMPDEKEIRRRVRDGLRECAGLRIYQDDELAVRSQ